MMMGMGSLVLAAALLGSAGACRCASAPGAIKLDGGACVLPITDGTRTVAASAVLPGVDWTKLTQRDGSSGIRRDCASCARGFTGQLRLHRRMGHGSGCRLEPRRPSARVAIVALCVEGQFQHIGA